MKSVEKEGVRGLRLKRNPTALTPADFFTDSERLREAFAALINAGNAKRIAIINSVSYGMAAVANNLRLERGQHILVTGEQFPSNVYPWQNVCAAAGAEIKTIAPPEGTVDRGKRWNEAILEGINNKTRAVAIAHTHWTDGTRFHLEEIRKRTADVGALLIIDGTQSVGALPFDVASIKPDALVCSGYKWLFGPYGIGLAYYGEYFDDGRPVEENWINRLNSEDFSQLVNYQTAYQPGALRFDMGEHSNFIMVPMLLKAVTQLNKWKVQNIQQYCEYITKDAVIKLQEKGFWVEDLPYRAHHLIGVRLPPRADLEKVKSKLLKEEIYVSYRSNAIRVAPNVYNDENDLAKLVTVLSKF